MNENETAEQAFNRLLPDNDECSRYHERLQAMLKAQSTLRKINEARKAEAVQQESKEDEEIQVLGEAKSAMQDMAEMNANPSDSIPLDERVEMLNADQRRIYDHVRTHLLHHKQHEDGICQCEIKPLTMFVSGVGGTGKSFLIEAVKALTDTLWSSDDLKCGITAPTWLAAEVSLSIDFWYSSQTD